MNFASIQRAWKPTEAVSIFIPAAMTKTVITLLSSGEKNAYIDILKSSSSGHQWKGDVFHMLREHFPKIYSKLQSQWSGESVISDLLLPL